jgi:Oxidoreductase molybdopterin binding domain
VALLSVLQDAGIDTVLKMDPKIDPKIKNYNLRLVVVIHGTDGYTTTFSLAELLPDIGNREAWLALDEDGQALSAKEGPVKLIVPSDAKPGRWVRALDSITVLDPTSAATSRPVLP